MEREPNLNHAKSSDSTPNIYILIYGFPLRRKVGSKVFFFYYGFQRQESLDLKLKKIFLLLNTRGSEMSNDEYLVNSPFKNGDII